MLLRLTILFLTVGWPPLHLFAEPSPSVVIFAAASTTHVVTGAAEEFTNLTGIRTITSFAASSTLARQIESGAPADLYISANLKWMAYLEKRNLVRPGSRSMLFSNTLVLISGNYGSLQLDIGPTTPLLNLLNDGYLAMANPDHTPVGMYAKESLQTLGLWGSVENRIARTKDVRAALMLVERKETPLGIVYLTDALASNKINVIGGFPQQSHAPIVYLCALTADAKEPGATAFFRFLHSTRAKTIFKGHGFKVE